jgi:hypothetical protein
MRRQFFVAALVRRKVGVRPERFQCVSCQEIARAVSEQAVYKLARHNTTLTADATSRIDKD